MHVDVVDGLSALLVAVHHHAETFLAALLPGQALGDEEHVSGQQPVFFAQVGEGGNVLLGDDQEMHRRLRADVVEGDDLIVFVELARRDLPGGDLAK